MLPRGLPLFLAVLYCFASAQSAPAQESQETKDPTALERRVKVLEDRVNKLAKIVDQLPAGLLESKKAKWQLKKVPALEDPKAELRLELMVFRLKNADANELTVIVQKLLRGMTPYKYSLAAEPRTNTILFYGQREAAVLIEAVVIRLDKITEKKTGPPK